MTAQKYSLYSLGLACVAGLTVGFFIATLYSIQTVAEMPSDSITKAMEQKEIVLNSSHSSRAPPSPYLIRLAQERDRNYGSLVHPRFQKLAKDHPAFSQQKEFQPSIKWEQTHFPDINILGLRKGGSSQLYNILSSHRQVQSFHRQAEFCFDIDDETLDRLIYPTLGNSTVEDRYKIQQALYMANDEPRHSKDEQVYRRWESLNRKPSSQGDKYTVNKCLSPEKVLLQRQYLYSSNQTTRKEWFIVVLRDPADWLWAAWNFWRQPFEYDTKSSVYKTNWASAPAQYRSPELFHEYMLAGDRLGNSLHLLNTFRDIHVMRFQALVEEAFDSQNVLVLKNEDMQPDRVDSSGFLDKLADFLGLDKDGFDVKTLHGHSNCGDNKGTHNHECNTEKEPGAYEITGNRGLWNETRELVYLHFASECYLWKEKFNIEYKDCLAVHDKYVVASTRKV